MSDNCAPWLTRYSDSQLLAVMAETARKLLGYLEIMSQTHYSSGKHIDAKVDFARLDESYQAMLEECSVNRSPAILSEHHKQYS